MKCPNKVIEDQPSNYTYQKLSQHQTRPDALG